MRYYLTCLPGLSGILTREARAVIGGDFLVRKIVRTRNNEILVVDFGGRVADLLKLRVAEDVFVAVGQMKLTGQINDVRALAASAMWRKPLQKALAIWSRATGRPLVKRLTWRVVTQADDVQWRQYRRAEFVMAAESGLLNTGTSLRVRRDEAPLEIWQWQIDRELIVALRLTNNESRQHGGRETERLAALRPSAAAAMVFLSEPADNDVFLDPMCGSGTVLLERAMSGRYEMLLGGDNDRGAIEAALANFGSRHQPRQIKLWDARNLPLDDASVDKIACNLPWGRKIGDLDSLPALYRDFLKEAARVLRPCGRIVLLTSEWNVLKKALSVRADLDVLESVRNVVILGRRADIFVAVKK